MITKQQSIQVENLEQKLAQSGKVVGAVTYNPHDNYIYLGDGRDYLDKSMKLINVDLFDQMSILGASGEVDKANKIDPYTALYYEMFGDYNKILEALSEYSMPYHQVAGAAGSEATLNYENIRRTGDLLEGVIGQNRILEEINAVRIAEKITSERLKFEFVTKTTALLIAQQEISDDVIPDPVRQAFALGEKEIFADATQWTVSMRDRKETKADITAEFMKEQPGMFLNAKQNKVIAFVNVLAGTNQGDWDARTAGIFDVRAAEQVQVGEDAIKNFGGQKIMLLNSDTWRLYEDNVGPNFDTHKPGNVSTTPISAKTGTLKGNPDVTYYINDNITSQAYVLASLGDYMKWFQGLVIQTSVKTQNTPGQAEQRFFFDFNGFEETEPAAAFRGETVGA